MYYLNARYYNPKLCRFISPDSILGANGDLHSYNLYAYCSNNPVMFSDPSGYVYVLYDPLNDFDRGKGGILPTANRIHNNTVNPPSYDKNTIRDVTDEIHNALTSYIQEESILIKVIRSILKLKSIKYYMFCEIVKDEAIWDIKEEKSWEGTIHTTFPGEGTKVTFRGKTMTPEDLGNFTYGYLGAYYSFPLGKLITGSTGWALIHGNLSSEDQVINELNDWNYIIMGYEAYNEGWWF